MIIKKGTILKYKKLFIFIKKTFKFPMSYLIFFLVFIIDRLFNIQISLVKPDRIGHLVGEIDQFLRIKKLQNIYNKKRRIIITGKACNQTAVKVMNRHVPIYQNSVIFKLLAFSRRTIKNKNFIIPLGLTQTLFELYKKINSIVSLTDDEIKNGYKLIKDKYGISKDDWWVCFHARDQAFTSSDYVMENTNSDLSIHDYRNCKIENMLTAMEYITSLGGYAIRYGSIAEERLETENDKIIDYTFNGRSDFLDVFLVARSNFFVGNTSGTSHLAKLFSVPYVMTNMIAYLGLPEQPNSLYMYKKIQDRKGKVLTFAECNKIGMFDTEKGKEFSVSNKYRDMNLNVLENSKEEILGSVKDMINLIKKNKLNDDIKLKQKRFISKYYSHYKDNKYAGKIAPSFLKINNNLF